MDNQVYIQITSIIRNEPASLLALLSCHALYICTRAFGIIWYGGKLFLILEIQGTYVITQKIFVT